MQLIDSHCHFDLPVFDADRAQVLERARAAGVARIVVPAIAAAGWPRLRAVCHQHPGLHPAYGLHPMFLDQHREDDLALLRTWIETERPCAVGECGLDFFVDGLDAERQRHFFRAQLQLAREHDLPVIVHARKAVEETIVTIRRIGGLRGVVHSFSGSPEQARQLADNGFLVSLGGPLTYERANRLRRLVASIPLDMLMLETDAPDQPDAGIAGQRNEPARLLAIAQAVAALRGQPVEEIAAATSANARRLFGLPAD